MKRAVMRRAWEIRKRAARRFGCKVSEIHFGECLRQAWAEVKAQEEGKIEIQGKVEAKDGDNSKTYPNKEALKKEGFRWSGVLWSKPYASKAERDEIVNFLHGLGLMVIIEEKGETVLIERRKDEMGPSRSYNDWSGYPERDMDECDGGYQEYRY